MSELIKFYRGEGVDDNQRTIIDILDMNIDEWECCHNFIQWIFPLPEPSQFNIKAPLLTKEDIQIFKTDSIIQQNICRAYLSFLSFLGLCYNKVDNLVIFDTDRILRFLGPLNHNHLRITRVLRFITLIGRDKDAIKLYTFLNNIQIPLASLNYWNIAIYES
jgi:hypothetical protein